MLKEIVLAITVAVFPGNFIDSDAQFIAPGETCQEAIDRIGKDFWAPLNPIYVQGTCSTFTVDVPEGAKTPLDRLNNTCKDHPELGVCA